MGYLIIKKRCLIGLFILGLVVGYRIKGCGILLFSFELNWIINLFFDVVWFYGDF